MPAKQTDPLHVPEGHRPEEFLTDEKLLALRKREFDAMKDDDPDKGQARVAMARAQAAAALTGISVAETLAQPGDDVGHDHAK